MINDEDISDAESDVEDTKKKANLSDDEDENEDDDEDDEDVDMSDFEDEETEFANEEEDGDKKLASELMMSDDDGDDDDDLDDLDENYLQKIDSDVSKNIIQEYHPEILSHNVEEVETACTIVRNEHGMIVDPMHRTLPFVTRYERARVIGERAKQINSGSMPFIPIDATLIDGYLIALQEFEQKKIPFIIRRPLPSGNSEYWRLTDLDII
jgi:DNA-directed RNA polymerases I, II, and III subunit RPABC2